ncbi:MAG: tRNA pseudouridine(38-40) synthase TruA [Pseudomonadota bacterium]|nr:tRNA pseudouridine(38-40) synthase TruA [Pseudomonadota bacterium]
MRMAAIIEYDGSGFCGWQRQDGARTVQGCVEEAFGKVADSVVPVTVAGRTDSGVHACAQVIHFDTEVVRSSHGWLRGANSNLPAGIAVLWTGQVAADFHARFSAVGREYRYVILNRSVRPSYLARRVTHEYRPLDVKCMRSAAQMLVGIHDFSSYRAVQCQAKSPVRELRRLDFERRGDLVIMTAVANAFLHHMVRNLAGVLMAIGAGEKPQSWAREVLDAHDRTLGGITAAADGLYLTGVEYPPHHGIPRLPPVSGLW